MSTRPTDGFIMRNGEFIALEDAERMYEQAKTRLETPQRIAAMTWDLGRECTTKGKYAGAQAYFEKALDTSTDDAVRAACLLSIGQIKEQQDEYHAAAEWYRKAFVLQPGGDTTWYFLYNNLGYCLNRLGCHQEALIHCQTAIAIDPRRYNAHKNLGAALEGLGRFLEAARSYLKAAEICPEDSRALGLLEALLARHPEIEARIPEIRERIEACRKQPTTSVN